ncbi:MAG: carbohydrate-binding protein [Ignavibacteriales bacterium]
MQNIGENDRLQNTKAGMSSRWNKFLTEFAKEKPIIGNYSSKGIWLVPEGRKIRLKYNGILADNGAQDIYTAVSYGSNSYWEDVKYYKMDKVDYNTFETFIPASERTNFNICFKDGANNWDNNSGTNYTFDSF